MKITLQFKYASGICRYLFNLHLWHIIEQAHESGTDIQKFPKVGSEDVNVILKICKFIKSDHHFIKAKYSSGSQLRTVLPLGGSLAKSGNISGCHNWIGEKGGCATGT